MKRGLLMMAIVAVLLVGMVAVAQARGPGGGWGGQGGPGMMGGGGPGMMGGRGGMMGGGGAGCVFQNGTGTYDPALAASRADLMVTQHKAHLTQLEAQLAAATDANVKAALTIRIERQKLATGAAEVHATVLKAQPLTWQEAALATARAEVEYWGKATATDSTNQAWIGVRQAQVKAHLTYIESLQPKTN